MISFLPWDFTKDISGQPHVDRQQTEQRGTWNFQQHYNAGISFKLKPKCTFPVLKKMSKDSKGSPRW